MADGSKKPALNYRALDVVPGSYDAETRTVAVVWSTGADVSRSDWSGNRWVERLSMEPKAIRLGRLNSGAPLLDSHDGYSVSSIYGTTVPGSATIQDGEGRAKVLLSSDPAKAGVVGDVAAGVIRSISVGYVTHAQTIDKPKGGCEVRTATDWEPYEISLVAMPADPGAAVRDAQPLEPTMSIDTTPAAPIDLDAVRAAAITAERTRVAEITVAAAAVRLADVGAKLIADGVTADEARKALISEVATRGNATASAGHSIQITADSGEVKGRALESALLKRIAPKTVLEKGNPYEGMPMARIAEEILRERGIIGAGQYVSPTKAVQMAMAHRVHSTSDFANILANVQNKALMVAYGSEGLNFEAFCTRRDLPDFKSGKLVNVLPLGNMVQVAEGAPVQYATRTDTGETYALLTYSGGFAITRQAIANDDLSALADTPMSHGAAAARVQKDVVWGIITANAAMADTIALFHASHSNLGTAAAMSATTLGELRKLARLQTAGSQTLNLTLAHLIVPAALENAAYTLLQPQADVAQAASLSVVPGLRSLNLIVESRLDANSTTAHYAASASSGIYYGYLSSSGGPVVEQVIDFDTDAIKSKCTLDFGASVGDYRYLYKNAGA